jgi:hypothetical protein
MNIEQGMSKEEGEENATSGRKKTREVWFD